MVSYIKATQAQESLKEAREWVYSAEGFDGRRHLAQRRGDTEIIGLKSTSHRHRLGSTASLPSPGHGDCGGWGLGEACTRSYHSKSYNAAAIDTESNALRADLAVTEQQRHLRICSVARRTPSCLKVFFCFFFFFGSGVRRETKVARLRAAGHRRAKDAGFPTVPVRDRRTPNKGRAFYKLTRWTLTRRRLVEGRGQRTSELRDAVRPPPTEPKETSHGHARAASRASGGRTLTCCDRLRLLACRSRLFELRGFRASWSRGLQRCTAMRYRSATL